MPGNLDIAGTIKVLASIESIKNLKAKYWRCVDNKLWEEIAECFAEDMVFHEFSLDEVLLPSRALSTSNATRRRVKGRAAVAQVLAQALGSSNVTTVHQGYAPEIEITGDTTAKGKWAFCDTIISKEKNVEFRGWGRYEDEYVFEGGKWRIKSFRVVRQLCEARVYGKIW